MSSDLLTVLVGLALAVIPRPCPASEGLLARNQAAAQVAFHQLLGGGWHVAPSGAVHTVDFVAHGPTHDSHLETDRRAALGWKGAAPDLAMTVHAVDAKRDFVATRRMGRGPDTGAGGGLLAIGRGSAIRGMTVLRTRNGRGAEAWSVVDRLEGLPHPKLPLDGEGSQPCAPADAAAETAANRALARRIFDEILNRGRYELFDELYRPDFVKHVDRHASTLAEEIRDARAMRAASSDLVMTADQVIAEGNRVAILYTGRGTHMGLFAGLPPTGRKYVVSGVTVYRFANGKVAEEWTSYNMLDVLRQFGYTSHCGATGSGLEHPRGRRSTPSKNP
jgi:steroid delta-isomerase-like uncharacterized protein